jgi:cobalt-zinc-cadmium efflux system outer membrane protein
MRCVGCAVTLVLAGCVNTAVPPATLQVEKSAVAFDARTLRDAGLQAFLQENLGRVPADTWDFEALGWVAFYYNPSLALARVQWETARTAERGATERPNPTLALTPGYNTTREAGVSPWMPSVNLDFLLSTANKRGHQRDIAAHDAEAARLAIASAAWSVRSELRKALLAASAAARQEASLRQQVDVQRRLVELLQQRFALGAIAAPDVSNVRTAYIRAESAAANAASQAASARGQVAAALGVPLAALNNVTLPAPAATPPLSAETIAEARHRSLRTRADVLAALAKYQAAHAALELEIAKQKPDLHLGPGYQWDQGPNKWTLAVSFELPIFNHNEAAIATAVARREEAAAQFAVVQAQAIAAIDSAAAAQSAATAQLDRARRLREEVARQTALVEQRLAAGGADQVDVQTARLDLATTDAAVADAENASAAATGALEDALQIPFPRLEALLSSSHASNLSP